MLVTVIVMLLFCRFQFAASQWQLLVSSAEDLLSEILQSTQVSLAEKTRIESWLCMKAEAEECIGADLGPLRHNSAANRVLEVIGLFTGCAIYSKSYY